MSNTDRSGDRHADGGAHSGRIKRIRVEIGAFAAGTKQAMRFGYRERGIPGACLALCLSPALWLIARSMDKAADEVGMAFDEASQ